MTEAIVITLSARYSRTGTRSDVARCTWKGHRFEAVSRHGACMTLARLLVASSVPDQPYEARNEDGHPLFFGPSLHRLARLAILESDRAGPRFAPFRKAPRSWRGRRAHTAQMGRQVVG